MQYINHITDPNNHNPENFTYFVHGILDRTQSSLETNSEFLDTKLQKLTDPDTYFSSSLVGKLSKKHADERLGWKGDELHQTDTYGMRGFIIEPTIDEVVQIAWNSDIGSPRTRDELEEYVQEHRGKKLSTQELLSRSIVYNEVIMQGHPETKVRGLFYTEGDERARENIEIIRNYLTRQMEEELSIIALPKPKHEEFELERVEISLMRFALHDLNNNHISGQPKNIAESMILPSHYADNNSELTRPDPRTKQTKLVVNYESIVKDFSDTFDIDTKETIDYHSTPTMQPQIEEKPEDTDISKLTNSKSKIVEP